MGDVKKLQCCDMKVPSTFAESLWRDGKSRVSSRVTGSSVPIPPQLLAEVLSMLFVNTVVDELSWRWSGPGTSVLLARWFCSNHGNDGLAFVV